jgi:hypothetical protein
VDNFCFAPAGSKGKRGNCHWQGEARRTSATWIDEENLAALLDNRLVRMVGDHGGEANRGRLEVGLREIVKDIDRVVSDLDDIAGRKPGSPGVSLSLLPRIVRTGAMVGECFRDAWTADVATMNDEVRVPERIECLWPNQTMGLRQDRRDEADPTRDHLEVLCLERARRIPHSFTPRTELIF